MEVRSSEKCGNDAVAATTTTINQSTELNIETQDDVIMDQSKTTVNDEFIPLTKDESK